MARVRILCGPKRSGRTAAFDALIHEHWPRALVVTPTAGYERAVTERILLDGGHAGAWGQRVATFPQFVDALLESFGERAVRLTEFERVRLVQGLLDTLGADGALEGLGRSATTPGFRNQVLRAIVELKQAAVEPGHFRKALGKPGQGAPYHRLLATLYEHYQDALLHSGKYDTVGLYWRAEVLAQGACPPLLEGVELLALDGFDDFTPSELRLVKTLAGHAGNAAISLAFDPQEEAQSTLHALLHATLKKLEDAFPGCDVARYSEPPPETEPHYAARHVFSIEDPPAPDGLQPGVRFVACGSAQLEREHLARRVKCLLVDERLAADAIAVCIPQLDRHLGPVRQAFEAAGIPIRLRDKRPVADGAATRFLAEVLRAVTAWSAEDVLAVLASPWLDATLGAAGRGFEPLIVRKALITGGREQWAKRLDYYDGELASKGNEHHDARRYPGVLAAVRAMRARFDWLSEQADVLAAAATESALADALTRLLMGLDPGALLHALPNAQRPAETAAVRALFEALGRAQSSGSHAPIADAPGWLEDLALHTDFSRGGAGTGVLISDPAGIRHLSFQRVLFANLNEGVLPSKRPADPLFSDHDREHLREKGLALEDREHHARREMTLFHRVLESAAERIELSWSIADGDGRERFPSPFVGEVRRLVPTAAATDIAADLYPSPAEAAAPREVFGCAFGEGPALASAAQALDGALFEAVTLGSTIEQGRYGAEDFDAHDGVVSAPASIEGLIGRLGEEHTWSAAQFETYNACPMLYFLRYVLDIEEPEPPKEEVDPKTRGALVHAVLERFLRHHPTKRLDAIGLGDGERLEAVVDEVFQDREGHPALRCVPRGVLAAERARMKAELSRFVRMQDEWEENAGWMAAQFELDFGRKDSERGPFALTIEDMTVQVAGVIDRVDISADGNARLIDYKTGALPATGELQNGSKLQLGLYALAWAHHLSPGKPCTQAYYLRPTTGEVQDALQGKQQPDPEGRRKAMLASIEKAVRDARAGRFPPVLAKNAKLYGFKRAVRHESGRIDRKTGMVSDDED